MQPKANVAVNSIGFKLADEGDDRDRVTQVLMSEGNETLPPLNEVEARVSFEDTERTIKVVKPPGVDELWQWYEERGEMDADPSWGKIWQTSRVLASCLMLHDDDKEASEPLVDFHSMLVGKRVLEVGCGLGLAGLAAAMFARPSSVVFCDREPLAVHLALSSAAVNELKVVPVSDLGGSGGADDVVRVCGALLDWAKPQETLQGTVDTVLGADVLYDPDTASLLAKACGVLTGGKGGNVVLCEPFKERAIGCRKAFLTACEECGASKAEVIEFPVDAEGSSCVLVVATWL